MLPHGAFLFANSHLPLAAHSAAMTLIDLCHPRMDPALAGTVAAQRTAMTDASEPAQPSSSPLVRLRPKPRRLYQAGSDLCERWSGVSVPSRNLRPAQPSAINHRPPLPRIGRCIAPPVSKHHGQCPGQTHHVCAVVI